MNGVCMGSLFLRIATLALNIQKVFAVILCSGCNLHLQVQEVHSKQVLRDRDALLSRSENVQIDLAMIG